MNVNPIVTAWLTQPGGVTSRLKELRSGAGLSQGRLADALGGSWTQSKVSRLESGRQKPSDGDVREWATACGNPAAAGWLVRQLAQMRSQRIGHRSGLEALQAPYVELVDRSSFVCQVDVTFVPGLLQTADYTRHLLAKLMSLDPRDEPEAPEAIERAVAARVRRQQGLYDLAKRFEFIVTESVLRLVLVPADVMAGQLDRLQSVLGLPNVRLGVIPFGVELATAPQNKFEAYDESVIVESFAEDTVAGDEDAKLYLHILGLLWADAVEGDVARQLIIRAADDLRRA